LNCVCKTVDHVSSKLILLAFITGSSRLESLVDGLFSSNPFIFQTGFQLELNRETADNPHLLTPALFSIEFW